MKTFKKLFHRLFDNRQHPIRILGYTTRSFWLILIPLTRNLVASRYDIAAWLRGSWLSILTIIVIFGYAFVRWLTISYRIENGCIVAKSGYFGLLESKIYFENITSVSASQGVIYRLFRAHKVYLNTNSGARVGSDVMLTMKNSDYLRLFEILMPDSVKPDKREERSGRFSYKPKRSQLLVFSLLFSSSLSGIIIAVTFLLQGSKIIGENLQNSIRLGIYDLTRHVEKLVRNIPPIAIAASIVIFATWLISFAANLCRHWSFRSIRWGDKIIIKSGFITKRAHILNRRDIVCVDVQQSLLMMACKICSVRIHCNGYGSANREINVLIPITTAKEVACSMKLLVPEFPMPKKSVRPKLSGIMYYVLPPLIFCLALPCVGYAARLFFHSWSNIIRFAVFIGEIPGIWLAMVKMVSGFTTGAGFGDGYLRLDCCRWYAFHTLIIPVQHISKLSKRQSWTQFLKDNCNIRVRTATLSSKTHTVKNLRCDDVDGLFCRSGIELLIGRL